MEVVVRGDEGYEMSISEYGTSNLVLCIGLMVLVITGCSEDPVEPPPFDLPTNSVLVNGGESTTASMQIVVVVTEPGLESALIWNGSADDRSTGIWHSATNDSVRIMDWSIGERDGLHCVNVVAKVGGIESKPVHVEVILDTTPPQIPSQPNYPPEAAQNLSTALALRWPEATDEWSGAGEIHYIVLAGLVGAAPDTIYSGFDTRCVIGGLGVGDEVSWIVEAEDRVGNRTVGPTWTFGVWTWDLPAFAAIGPGTFQMGSPISERGHSSIEIQHEVTLTRRFLFAETELTVGQCTSLMNWALSRGYVAMSGDTVVSTVVAEHLPLFFVNESGNTMTWNGSAFIAERPELIMSDVSWYGATAICAWLGEIGGFEVRQPGIGDWNDQVTDPYSLEGYRLPTEAEWEYAARAGSETAFANGDIGSDDWYDPVLAEIGWYLGNFRQFNFQPAQLIPNAWGIYDMHGGMPDWCWDWYGPYSGESVVDPVNEKHELLDIRVIRGTDGIIGPLPTDCRSGFRSGWKPYECQWYLNTVRLLWSPGN